MSNTNATVVMAPVKKTSVKEEVYIIPQDKWAYVYAAATFFLVLGALFMLVVPFFVN